MRISLNSARIYRFLIFPAVVVRKPGKKSSSGLTCVWKIHRGIGLALTQ
jgi:hypothetical protein